MTVTQDEENSTPEPGRWDLNWDRFAAGLTSLVSLNVDERLKGISVECRYVGRVGYVHISAPVPIDGADAAALERFRMTVASRSEEARRASWEAKGSI